MFKLNRMLNSSVTISSPSDTIITQTTKTLEGDRNVIKTILQFVSNTRVRIDACIDYSRPSLAIEFKRLKKAFLDAKRKGIKLRYVTEITEYNVVHCKELIKIVDELRHLEGIRGNFYVNETEYIAPATLHEKGKPASQIIYSNVKEIVEHHKHYVFDTLWSRAIPAKQRIREIEKGGIASLSDETKIALEYQYQIFKKLKDSIEKDQINKIRSMLRPIIQKQAKDAKRQLELIKQLQSQQRQMQKQLSYIQKTMAGTKKKDR